MCTRELYSERFDKEFPSPLGVIFSLMSIIASGALLGSNRFPSPLGVIFSLIKIQLKLWKIGELKMFPSPLGVIFSLIDNINNFYMDISINSFRLLSELYSLL